MCLVTFPDSGNVPYCAGALVAGIAGALVAGISFAAGAFVIGTLGADIIGALVAVAAGALVAGISGGVFFSACFWQPANNPTPANPNTAINDNIFFISN